MPESISDKIYKDYFQPSSSIEKYGDTFKIRIKHPQKDSTIEFTALLDHKKEGIATYLFGDINYCSKVDNSFAYFPSDVKVIFKGIEKNKIYGVIDDLKCCQEACSITILQRYYRQQLEIAIPILFFIYCKNNLNGCDLYDDGAELKNGFGKQIVSICESRSDPATKSTIAPPTRTRR